MPRHGLRQNNCYIYDIFHVLLSTDITQSMIEASRRSESKISNFDTSCVEVDGNVLTDNNGIVDEDDLDRLHNNNYYIDEEKKELLGKSKFKKRADKMYKQVSKSVIEEQGMCSSDATGNARCSKTFAEKIVQYLHTYPIHWLYHAAGPQETFH